MNDDLISKKKEIEKKYKEQLQQTIFNEEKGEELWTDKSNSNGDMILNYLVSIILGVLNGFLLLTTRYFDMRDLPPWYGSDNANMFAGFFGILFLSLVFTGISRLFTKDKNKFSKDFMWSSIRIFVFIIIPAIIFKSIS